MNGENKKKDKKSKMKPHENETSEASISKQNDKKLMDNEAQSEEPEILEKLSPKNKKRFVEAVLSMSMERISGSALSPFESKINEKHIDKILEIKEKYDDKIFTDTQQSRKFLLAYILIGVALFVFLTLFLVSNDKDLFKDIIKLFIAFVGGIGAGYGIKSYKDNK